MLGEDFIYISYKLAKYVKTHSNFRRFPVCFEDVNQQAPKHRRIYVCLVYPAFVPFLAIIKYYWIFAIECCYFRPSAIYSCIDTLIGDGVVDLVPYHLAGSHPASIESVAVRVKAASSRPVALLLNQSLCTMLVTTFLTPQSLIS